MSVQFSRWTYDLVEVTAPAFSLSILSFRMPATLGYFLELVHSHEYNSGVSTVPTMPNVYSWLLRVVSSLGRSQSPLSHLNP